MSYSNLAKNTQVDQVTALAALFGNDLAKVAEKQGFLIGRHSFIAYEGDIEYKQNEDTGIWLPENPIVFRSPIKNNLIVTTGKSGVLNRLAGLSSVAAFGYIGVGTDSTAASTSQTQLNPSVSGSTLIQVTDSSYPSLSGLVLTFKSTFGTSVANFNWNEAGIFNGTTNGTSVMFNRVVIGPFNKTTAVSISYTTSITQS